MGQKRLRNYLHKILSFEHNIGNLGMHNPGRYCGFDTLIRVGALQFNISHVATGQSYKDPINTTVGPLGMALTPQGVIITEDATLTGFNVPTNAGNAEIRYHLLVMEHNFVNLSGGQAATYFILSGPTNNPIKPVVANPFKQIPLGVIAMQPNSNDVADATYTKWKSPDSGDGEDARLNDVNIFKAIQVLNRSNLTYTVPTATNVSGSINEDLWQFENDGNVFTLEPAAPTLFSGFKIRDVSIQEGARIWIMANSNCFFGQSYAWLPTYASKGFAKLFINPALNNATMPTSTNGLVVNPSVGEHWEMEFVYYGGGWYLSKIGGVGSNSAFKRGMTILWTGNDVLNFDPTGLGMNLMSGWARCNGLNGTQDLRGLIPVMSRYDDAGSTDISGDIIAGTRIDITPNANLGKVNSLILRENLPNFDFPITDPGHIHTLFFNEYPDSATSNPGYDGGTNHYQTNVAKATNPSTTGITVHSGGSDLLLPTLSPVVGATYIMKL